LKTTCACARTHTPPTKAQRRSCLPQSRPPDVRRNGNGNVILGRGMADDDDDDDGVGEEHSTRGNRTRCCCSWGPTMAACPSEEMD
jgi:hypothetical protein